MEQKEFIGKTAIVTGATSGIGRAAAAAFARAGADVVAVGRNAANLIELDDEITKAGGRVKTVSADVTDEAEAARIAATAVEAFGKIDILVNSAGIISNGSIENTSLAQWDETMNVNVRAVFNLTRLTVPHLIKQRGNVVNVSSVTGLRAFPGVLAYCVSKAAVDQLTRCAALELAPQGVRINAVNPGVVVTDLHRRGGMSDGDYTAFLEKSKQTHPLGRAGNAEEVADLILFLASERAAWITGATYSIDGGRAQTCAR